MELSKDRITQIRMVNQYISAPIKGTPQDVVGLLAAVQAQDYAGAKWGLGLRLQETQDKQVEEAFEKGRILRTHLMRPTWHFVTPDDIRWLLRLTAERVRLAMGSTLRQQKVDDDLIKRSHQSIEKALGRWGQLTRDELRQALEQDGIEVASGQRLGLIMMLAELDGIVCSGPRKGKQFTYMLLDERAPVGKTLDREESLAELARRFFLSRGPATVHDFARWSGLTLGLARQGLEAVEDFLIEEQYDARSYWMAPAAHPVIDGGPTAYLMSVYDEYLSAYRDRSAMLDPLYVDRLRGLGNSLINVIVVDGQVVGAWRRTEKKDQVAIELNRFKSFGTEEDQAVTRAAKRYAGFINKREVKITNRTKG